MQWNVGVPTSTRSLLFLIPLLIVGEAIISILIIRLRGYTEIDWKAYMDEVKGVIDGDYNYSNLKGDTGPLVYPAGFVWIYMVLYYSTGSGVDILRGQYIFIGFYLVSISFLQPYCGYIFSPSEQINLSIVLLIYRKVIQSEERNRENGGTSFWKGMPAWVLILLCLSYRTHSIFLLRLFNDGVCVTFMHAAILAMIYHYWAAGCLLFSIALSIKMNILLFAPGLLLLLVKSFGVIKAMVYLIEIAVFQILVGAPFLTTFPNEYLNGSFNFGRQFLYVWTVNWKFVSEEVFLSKQFAVILLILHLGVLCVFGLFRWCKHEGGVFGVLFGPNEQLKSGTHAKLSAPHICLILFSSNFIGICFARSLHYQFYSWYFYSIPLLLWFTPYPPVVRLLLQGVVESVWMHFPADAYSSLALQICHAAILLGLFIAPLPRTYEVEEKQLKKNDDVKRTVGVNKKKAQ